jgi:hypothetical protein
VNAFQTLPRWAVNKKPFRLLFNASLKVDFQGSQVTSDYGVTLARELDERFVFDDLLAKHLTDSRRKQRRTSRKEDHRYSARRVRCRPGGFSP